MVRGEIEQSIINCKKAVELEPGNSLSVALLGNVLIDSGRIEEGIRWLKRAIRLCPESTGLVLFTTRSRLPFQW